MFFHQWARGDIYECDMDKEVCTGPANIQGPGCARAAAHLQRPGAHLQKNHPNECQTMVRSQVSNSHLKKKYLFIWVFFAGPTLFLVAESRGYSIVVYGLLIAVASLVVEHGLQGTQASVVVATSLVALWHVGSSGTSD